jgi:hypothetical protein
VYGACSALDEGRGELAEWLGWLDWVSHLVLDLAEGAGHLPNSETVPAWLRTGIETLERADDDEPYGVDATEFSHWATLACERIAEKARPIERLGGEPLGEIADQPNRAGMRLFGLVQDSLILASIEGEASRFKRADARAVAEHLMAARDEGVWSALTQ